MSETTFHVGGMSCAHCVEVLRKGLASLPEVTVIGIGIGWVTLRYDETRVPASAIHHAVNAAGYTVVG